MNPLVLIPARGGSKGVPHKNLREFSGKPLVAWAIEVGKQIATPWVSTEDDKIVQLALHYGAEVMFRDPALATDEAPMLPVVQAAIELGDWDAVVLLQPTQPLRTVEHVRKAMDMLTEGWDSVVSVIRIPAHYSPDYAMTIEDGGLEELFVSPPRRQNCRPAYSRDGTVYVVRRETIEAGSLYGRDCRALVIPASESCNIDTEEDWVRAEQMAQKAVA